MSRADDVEFLAADGSESAPSEEVLVVGRRRGPRWLWPGAAVAVAVVLAGVVAGRAVSGHHHARPAPAFTGTTVAKGPPPARQRSVGPPFDVGDDAVLDVVTVRQHMWALRADYRLTGFGIAAGRDHTVRLPQIALTDPYAAVRLVLDATRARLWVVVEGTRSGRAIEYDLWTLARRRDVRLPWIASAAALNGHLYATSGTTLVDVAPTGAPRSIRTLSTSSVFAVAADPARSRVIILAGGFPTHVWTYRPAAGLRAIPETLPFGKGSIAVSDNAIWVGGFAQHGAVVDRLDPATLRPMLTSPIAARLGPGAVLLAGGAGQVWAVAGDGRSGLWCVDGRSGKAARFWPLTPNAVAADEHRLIAVIDGHVIPLLLTCRTPPADRSPRSC